MTVEILWPDVANLFGDSGNVKYLRDALPGADFAYTRPGERPFFADGEPALVYVGSMTEKAQREMLRQLAPYRDRLASLVASGTVILATGSGCEIFAKEIDYVSEEIKTEGLGLVDLTVRTDFFNRYNGKVLGAFEGLDVIGFRSQFGFLYGDNSGCAFLDVQRGVGINKESKKEGFRVNNLIGTQLIGPLLPLNPELARRILALAGLEGEPAYADKARRAYDARLREFKNPETVF